MKKNIKLTMLLVGILLVVMCIFNCNKVEAVSQQVIDYVDKLNITEAEKEIVKNIPQTIELNKMVSEKLDEILDYKVVITRQDLKDPSILPEGYSIEAVLTNAHAIQNAEVALLKKDNKQVCQLGEGKVILYKDEEYKTEDLSKKVKNFVNKVWGEEGIEYRFEYTGDTTKNTIPKADMDKAKEKLILDLKQLAKENNFENATFTLSQADFSPSSENSSATIYYAILISVDGIYYDGFTAIQEFVKEDKPSDKVIVTIDKQTDIKLTAPNGEVPANTNLVVSVITEGPIYNKVKTEWVDVNKFKAFDITLKSDGVTIQPNGKVKIGIPVPKDFDTSKLIVYRITDNGKKVEYPVTLVDGVATFETDHFSTYVLAEKVVKEETKPSTEKPTTPSKPVEKEHKLDETPKTGVQANILTTILSIITLTSIAGIIILKKK